MSKGHVFLAQNSEDDYVRQAYALALSIKIQNKEFNRTCLITNDVVPDEYKHAFDYIVPIPWNDSARDSRWKIENRWKLIHASPFDETLAYDTDMLLLESNDSWWDKLKNFDFCLTNNVRTYRGSAVTSDFYRKTFTENRLANVYTGCFYFKKTKPSYEFFKWLEFIVNNWQLVYNEHLKKSKQQFCSLDVSAALALKFMDAECSLKNNILSFVHMKPAIQDWKTVPARWTDVLTCHISRDIVLDVGNYRQSGLFHYVEDRFLTDRFLNLLKDTYEKV